MSGDLVKNDTISRQSVIVGRFIIYLFHWLDVCFRKSPVPQSQTDSVLIFHQLKYQVEVPVPSSNLNCRHIIANGQLSMHYTMHIRLANESVSP